MENHITDQARFCRDLMLRLRDAVNTHELARDASEKRYHVYLNFDNGVAQSGATKTQIQADIVRLRRELNVLSKMMEEN